MHKIVVLCGGKGKRLGQLTEEIPKPLVPLAGKPIIHHIVDNYSKKGISEFIFCIGYKGGMIKDYFSGFEEISFVDSGEEASMLKRIYDVKDLIDDYAVITYGDTITDLDFEDLLKQHKESGALVTMVTATHQSPFGLIKREGNLALTYEEKPTFNYYIGTLVLSKGAFGYIPEELLKIPDAGGIIGFFNVMIGLKKTSTYHYDGHQLTFNTHSEKKTAEETITYYTVGENKNGK